MKIARCVFYISYCTFSFFVLFLILKSIEFPGWQIPVFLMVNATVFGVGWSMGYANAIDNIVFSDENFTLGPDEHLNDPATSIEPTQDQPATSIEPTYE